MTTITTWKEGLSFESQFEEHTIKIDTTVKGGGANTGFNPKALLLAGLGGCTGMDIVDILRKMRVPLRSLEVKVEGPLSGSPRVFDEFRIHYRVGADTENREKVKKAVDLSIGKYCGVSFMLRKHAPISYEIELV